MPHIASIDESLLGCAAARAIRFLGTLDERPVAPTEDALAAIGRMGGDMPADGMLAEAVLTLLDEVGSSAAIASAGGRYFGFVIGGALPVTVAANWLAAAWDQNAATSSTSPFGAALEEIVLPWTAQLLGLPAGSAGALVTGASVATFTALAAARHALLARQGWHVERLGLQGAPALKIVVSEEVHVTVLKGLSLLGFGTDQVIRVPTDGQGRMRADQLPALDALSLVCVQAGNVNTGAFDPFEPICAAARAARAWVHVDGAFGLWAAVSPRLAALTRGIEQADSWATDAHKWLNVPYDCGICLVRDPAALTGAMSVKAAYLAPSGRRDPSDYGPELSRRARAIELWAALKHLGHSGVRSLIERSCEHAARLAARLRAHGFEILNDVVLNQVLAVWRDDTRTEALIRELQQRGECWCGGTSWQGRYAMRISVSGWATTVADMDRAFRAMTDAAASVDASSAEGVGHG